MTGLIPLSLRCALRMLRTGAPLLLLPGIFFLPCLLFQQRIGFDGLLPLLMSSFWLPLPLFMLLLRRQLPFLGPGDPSLAWALGLPVRKGAFRLFILAGVLGAALLLQFLISVQVGIGILALRPGTDLRLAEILRPQPQNPPLLSKKHPTQGFFGPRIQGKGVLSFHARRFLFSASGDRVRLRFDAKGGESKTLAEIQVGEDPRRSRLPLDLPPQEGLLQFGLIGPPHGPISFEKAPILWLVKPLSPLGIGAFLLLASLSWVLVLVCGGFAFTSFLQPKVYALTIAFLAMTPLFFPTFQSLGLAPLREGGIPLPSFSLSSSWPLALPILSLFPPRRHGGKG